jgi:F1F0 ATPase subunit 2
MDLSYIVLLIAFAAGGGIGVFYFGGLWLTVQHLPACRQPALWTFISFFIRTAASLLGFYWVMNGHWKRGLACLCGFLMMRLFLVRRWRPVSKGSSVESGKSYGY